MNILAKYMASFGHDVTVITAELDLIPEFLTSFFGRDNILEKDRAYEEQYGVKIIRLPLKRYISGRAIFADSLLDTIHQCQPDVLYVHGNDTYSAMWTIWNRKRIGCPIITDSHMSEAASSNRFRDLFRLFYRCCIAPIIKKEHITVIRTVNIPFVEKCLGIPLTQAPVISFGSDTLLFHPDADQRKAFREENGIQADDFVVVYAGKLDPSKGGEYLANLVCRTYDTARKLVFIIVGNAVGEYGAKVEDKLKQSPYRILRFPTQKYVDLAKFYQASDLAIFPRQCSLSFFDAQACGLPVISEDHPINIERCSHRNGWIFKADDLDSLCRTFEQVLQMDDSTLAEASENSRKLVMDHYNYLDKAREYENEVMKTASRFQKSHR